MNAPLPSHEAAALLPALSHQLNRFFHALDECCYDEVLELFTDDCRWLRQGRWLEGKLAVRAALQTRPLGSATRHVMSNMFLSRLDDECATLQAYMTAYRYPLGATGEQARVKGPLRLSAAPTVFRRDPGQDWRIVEQQLIVAFDFAEGST